VSLASAHDGSFAFERQDGGLLVKNLAEILCGNSPDRLTNRSLYKQIQERFDNECELLKRYWRKQGKPEGEWVALDAQICFSSLTLWDEGFSLLCGASMPSTQNVAGFSTVASEARASESPTAASEAKALDSSVAESEESAFDHSVAVREAIVPESPAAASEAIALGPTAAASEASALGYPAVSSEAMTQIRPKVGTIKTLLARVRVLGRFFLRTRKR